jgi:putative oxidoreductase
MGLGKLMLRATLGGYFVGHGMQKLAGWFGGAGPDGTGQHFEQIGLKPGRESALLAGAAEAGGGSLLALGLFTPAAVSMLTGVMTNAIRHVHAKNGPWVTEGESSTPSSSSPRWRRSQTAGRGVSPSTRSSGPGFAARS